MIFGVLRVFFLSLAGMAVLYVIISLYSRSVRRERLENEADEKIDAGELAQSGREGFIESGMRAYESSLRRKLIALVFAVPIIVVVAMIYVTNFL